MTITGYMALGSSQVFNLGDYDVTTPRLILYANSEWTMGSGKLTFTGSYGLGTNVYDGRKFTAGPGAEIIGEATKSNFSSGNDWTVVGKIENLDVSNEELNVTGQVINCTGEIHQWHNTIDSAQQLDRDTADDRDINLGRDIDKNTELVG
tara:strand:- start:154 stop:603 length:450 start_codon:yes stop_codon:yes gene_type:complete